MPLRSCDCASVGQLSSGEDKLVASLEFVFSARHSGYGENGCSRPDALAQRHEVVVLCGRPVLRPSERHPFYFLPRET